MLESLASKIKEYTSSKNFILLKNKITILTRESITAEYLSMQLVKKQVPSLSFETLRLVDFLEELKTEFLQKKELEKLSSFYAEVLLTQLIQESSFKTINSKTQTILARELLKEYENSIECDSQSYFQDTYKEIIKKFQTKKRKALTENEIYKQILETQISDFECIKSRKDFPLLLYGISSLSNFQWLILKKIDTSIPTEIYFCKPAILHFEGNEFKNLDSRHVLNQGFSIHVPENSSYNTKVYFYEAPEIHREVDFVAKSIMGKIAESSSDFHLTRIKVIIPDEPSYAISIKNTFQKFGIPFVFTNDVYINKQTAYYNAIYTLIQLTLSNFDRQIALKLFQNPCFSPLFPSEIQEGVNSRIVVHSEAWNVLMNVLKVEAYLDRTHRIENGLLEAEDLTWEGLWRRAVLAMQGEIEGVRLADEIIQEIPNFIKITHSLLHDLLYLKQSKFTPKDFEIFFKELLNVYLDYNRGMPEEEIPLYEFQERLQEGIYKKILISLKEISSSKQKEALPSEFYLNFLLEKLNQIRELSSQVLRYGVVVGSFVDTSDIIFDSMYVLGVDERRVPQRSAPKEYMLGSEYISARTKDYYLYSKASFYSIFHHAAKEIHISYVNRDSVGDKPIYPASTYRVLLEYFKDSSPSTIPLFTYLEPNFQQYKDLGLDKESILTIWLKQFEKEQQIQNIFPHWQEKDFDPKQEKLWENFDFKDKLIAQHFIAKLEFPNFILPEEIPLKRFLLYLDCPRKYFYTYTFRLEEESDLETEPKNYQALKIREIQKVFLDLVFANPQFSLDNLKPIFQSEFNKKISSKPSLFNQVEWRKVEPKLEEIFSRLRDTLGDTFFTNLKFQGQEEFGNIFPSGELFGKKVSGQVELLYFKNREANLVKFVFSKEISWRPILELYLQKESFSKAISSRWNNSKINLQVFHLDRDWKFESLFLKEVVEDKIFSYLETKWEEFTKQEKINFCAEPMVREESEFSRSPCSFCRFKKICHGYQISYEDDSRHKENSEFSSSLENQI